MNGNWWQRKVLPFLRQGISAEKLALCFALGAILGVTPVIGSTALLCAVAAVVLRLNLPAIQLVNFLVYPLQFALLIPFMRLGEWMLAAEPAPLSVAGILAVIRVGVWHAITTLWTSTMHALAAWVVVGPVAGAVLYLVLATALRRVAERRL